MTGPTATETAMVHPTVDPDLRPERPVWQRVALGGLWVAFLVAVVVVLGRLGEGRLSTPPLLDRSALRTWLEDRDAVVAAFALLRLVGLALAWYLLVVTGIGLAARVARVPALVRLADLATVPAVRRVLGTVAGVGLTASAASLVAAHMAPERPPVETAGPGSLSDREIVLSRLPSGDEVVMRRLAEGEEGTSTMHLEDDGGPGAGEPSAAEWEVAPGDHLWHIAETTLTGAWGRAPSDGELVPYWRGLIEANAHVLVDPDNPDLILPGQRILLPPPPPISDQF